MSKRARRQANPAEAAISRERKPAPPMAKVRPKERTSDLMDLPICPDIATWVKDGLPDAEIARRIQSQGFMVERSFDAVRMAVSRYRQNVLAPVDVVPERLSRGQVRAFRRLEQGMEELEILRRSGNELSYFIRQVRRIYQALGEMKGEVPDGGAEPAVPESTGEPHSGAVGDGAALADPRPELATREPFVVPARLSPPASKGTIFTDITGTRVPTRLKVARIVVPD